MEAGRGARGKVLSRWHAAAELGMADMRFFKDTAPSSRLSVPLSLEGCESYFVRETRGLLGGGVEELRKEQINCASAPRSPRNRVAPADTNRMSAPRGRVGYWITVLHLQGALLQILNGLFSSSLFHYFTSRGLHSLSLRFPAL